MSDTIRICLVEDDEADYLLFYNKLKKIDGYEEYTLDWFETYERGREAVLQQSHDIYFIDYTLGAKTGFNLIQEAFMTDHHGPFVMLTGSDNPALYKQFSTSGIYDYILKNELSPSLLDRSVTYSMERARVERDLREEKEFSINIIQHVPYLIIGVSESKIAFANPATLKTTGYEEDALIGEDWTFLFSDQGQADIQYVIEQDEHTTFKKSIRTKDGEERIIQWNLLDRRIANKHRGPINFILSGKDITYEMQREQNKKQREKMQALGQLAGGVAHEINNLLLPIQLSAELIRTKSTGDSGLELASEKITRNTKAASLVVEEILLFAREEQRDVQRLEIMSALNSVLETVYPMLPDTIIVDVTVDEQLHDVQWYVNQEDLLRVFSNLLINAAHAMDLEGVISLRLARQSGPKNENVIVIRITDQGCGIPSDIKSKIFEPFFTTKDVGKGTGLGLPIVYNVVQSWQGDIEVDSIVGEGTTFKISLPEIVERQ